MVYKKPNICKWCNAVNQHFSFQCRHIDKKEDKRKPKKPISPISKNRIEALKKYRRLRDKYFKDNPICEFKGCYSKDITLHHAKGRIGSFLTDKRYFKSLCLTHHRFVEDNPLEAIKMGLSFRRNEI